MFATKLTNHFIPESMKSLTRVVLLVVALLSTCILGSHIAKKEIKVLYLESKNSVTVIKITVVDPNKFHQ